MRSFLMALTVVLLVPAVAEAKVIDDTSRGYKLSINSKTLIVTLTIPQKLVGGKQNAYSITCKAKGGEESGLIGFIELDPERKLRGPGSYFPGKKMRLCRLETDGKTSANFKLK